jgi:hypothetical protein
MKNKSQNQRTRKDQKKPENLIVNQARNKRKTSTRIPQDIEP